MKHSITALLLLLISIPFASQGQKVTNVNFEQKEQQVIITYDLESENPADIDVFYSTDGGKSFGNKPIKHVRGDVGKNVQPGQNKRIVFHDLSELNTLYSKLVVFKVKAYESRAYNKAYNIESFGFINFMLNSGSHNPPIGVAFNIRFPEFGIIGVSGYSNLNISRRGLHHQRIQGFHITYGYPIRLPRRINLEQNLIIKAGLGYIFSDIPEGSKTFIKDYYDNFEQAKALPLTNLSDVTATSKIHFGLHYQLKFKKFYTQLGIIYYYGFNSPPEKEIKYYEDNNKIMKVDINPKHLQTLGPQFTIGYTLN